MPDIIRNVERKRSQDKERPQNRKAKTGERLSKMKSFFLEGDYDVLFQIKYAAKLILRQQTQEFKITKQ